MPRAHRGQTGVADDPAAELAVDECRTRCLSDCRMRYDLFTSLRISNRLFNLCNVSIYRQRKGGVTNPFHRRLAIFRKSSRKLSPRLADMRSNPRESSSFSTSSASLHKCSIPHFQNQIVVFSMPSVQRNPLVLQFFVTQHLGRKNIYFRLGYSIQRPAHTLSTVYQVSDLWDGNPTMLYE